MKTINKIYLGLGILVVVGIGAFYALHKPTQKLLGGAFSQSYVPTDASGNGLWATNFTVAQSLIDAGGSLAANLFDQGINGFNGPFSTSSALTAAQFCSTTNQLWSGTSALATSTLPSATSTYALCGSNAAFGAWNVNFITNNSTNTVNIVAGPGTTFLCETQGVGTSTIVGGCSTSQVSVLASTTAQAIGYWDGSSSSLYILWGNSWFN